MLRLADKILLVGATSFLYYFSFIKDPLSVLISIGVIVLITGAVTFIKNNYVLFAAYLIYLGVCCFSPLFTIFLPLFIYDLGYTAFKWSSILSLLPFLLFRDSFSVTVVAFTIVFLLTALLLCYKTSCIELLKQDYEAFRKTAKELALLQETKSKGILANQDYEIKNATLNERNRISKEIHDHVGHLLSRSLIQVGALLTISKEEGVADGLTDLKSSISEGMDSIRASIHDMHDESIDLQYILQKLVSEFLLCPVKYTYSIYSQPSLKTKYCFIAIMKEALANITKHAQESSCVIISLTEEDYLYQLSVFNNGSIEEKTIRMIKRCQARSEYPDGLGLQSISDRVKGLQGNFTIQAENGFELLITIPKEEQLNEFTID